MSILIVGSHPNNSNGYSKVIYNLCRNISENVYIYGCQKSSIDHNRILPENIKILDVSRIEKWNEIDEFGFNFRDIGLYVDIIKPKTIIIYNDAYVCNKFLESIIRFNELCSFDFKMKIVLYLDLVYPYIKQCYVSLFNEYVESIMVYHDYWKLFLEQRGIQCKINVLSHVYESKYIQNESDNKHMCLLNLNRNTLRKRLDITIRAYVYALKRTNINMKLYIKEPQEFDAWDIIEIFNNEMKTNNIDKYVVFLKNDLSEQEITSLYEYCDIGINTCEGEGFGLCNYEHAYHGKPQIMPNFPQFSGLYPEGSIYYIEPKHEYYIENRDANGGLAKVVDYQDVGEAILKLSSTDVYNTYTKNLNNFKKKSYKETSELFMNYIK